MQTGPTKMETLQGGIDFTVFLIDGASEVVRIRQIPLRRMVDYARAQDNEAEMVALLCDKPAEWVDRLSNESAEAIVVEGERLNESFFLRWVARQHQRAAKVQSESTSPTLSPSNR